MPKRLGFLHGYAPPRGSVPITRTTPWASPWTVTTTLHRDPYTGELTPGKFQFIITNADTGAYERTEHQLLDAHRTAARLYTAYTLPARLTSGELDLGPLAGRPLACYCPTGYPCHGDTLLIYANHPDPLALLEEGTLQ